MKRTSGHLGLQWRAQPGTDLAVVRPADGLLGGDCLGAYNNQTTANESGDLALQRRR